MCIPADKQLFSQTVWQKALQYEQNNLCFMKMYLYFVFFVKKIAQITGLFPTFFSQTLGLPCRFWKSRLEEMHRAQVGYD